VTRSCLGVWFGETDRRSGGLLPDGVSDAGLLSAGDGPRILGVDIHPFSSIAGKPWPGMNDGIVE
jgi:hypothetical protein